jgi:hypothetical protein
VSLLETILIGASKGLFTCVVIVVGMLFFSAVWSTIWQARAIARGELRFTDASELAQWFYLKFFRDIDGGGFA